VLAARAGGNGKRELLAMHWGLIPHWAMDGSIGSRLINARSESADTTPAFRGAFRHSRCVIPASGFYEWKKLSPSVKQPVYITAKDGSPLVFAGLCESWTDPDTGDNVDSCTILTTVANALLKPVHDRMPVVLDEKAWNTWLDPKVKDAEELKSLLKPAPAKRLAMHPVSRRVNSPRNDDASLIEPVEEGEETPTEKPAKAAVKPARRSSKGKSRKDDAGLFD
jgi:putative SOS response-associated peptidase YedK